MSSTNSKAANLQKEIEPQRRKGSQKLERLQLFDANGKPKAIKGLRIRKGPDAFAKDALFNQLIEWIGKEGPAFSKATFMVATLCEGLYAGWTAAHLNGEFVWLIAGMIWGVSLLLETSFGFAWWRTGSDKLAGDQVDLNETLYKRCLWLMAGGLVAALGSYLFSTQLPLKLWALVQVCGAISILRLQRLMKASHPEAEARRRAIDRKAKMNAAWIDELGREQDLYLERTAHARKVERKELSIQKEEDMKVLNGRQYRRIARQIARGNYLVAIATGNETEKTRSVMGKLGRFFNRN